MAKKYTVDRDRTGLGIGYRFGWRMAFLASFIYGSAHRQASLDPREQLREERARRLVAAYRIKNEQPPVEALRIAGYSG